MQSERWRCLYLSAYIVAAGMRLREEGCKDCELTLKVENQNDATTVRWAQEIQVIIIFLVALCVKLL